MEVQRPTQAMICATRCLDTAAEYLERGDVITAGALVRAAGRYLERIDEESRTIGVVKPSPPTRMTGARQGLRVIH